MSTGVPDPATGRRERRRREIHEQIIEAASRVFASKGFAGATALEIAEAADVAEKTFYNHFTTKQQLIEEMAQRGLSVFQQLFSDLLGSTGSTVERLRRFFDGSAEEAERTREFSREVIVEMLRTLEVPGQSVVYHDLLKNALRARFERGLAAGDIAPERDLAFLTEITAAAYLGIVINWVTLPAYPLRERMAQLADMVEELLAKRAPRAEALR
jgi:AcrR family transcriptional regulator